MRSRLALLVSLIIVPVLAACAYTSPIAPVQQASLSRQIVPSVRANVRFGLTTNQIESAKAVRGAGYFRGARSQATLFVLDVTSNSILLFPADEKNPKQNGSITRGIDLPTNAAVDSNGTLYVANNGNDTVTEYPLGQTRPSVTLARNRNGSYGNYLVAPNGITVDKKGTVYVTSGATIGQCYILVYPKGSSTPSVKIDGFNLPVGLSIDKDGNLYVGEALEDNVLWEVPKGSMTPHLLHLHGLDQATGTAIDPANNLWVSNDSGETVLGFHPGDRSPFSKISKGINGPYSLAIERNGTIFVANSYLTPGNIAGYKKGATTSFEAISAANPIGVAVYPPPNL